MTFLELQDDLLDRLNLSSDDARTRLKRFINQRVREVQTSCNLGRVRRVTRDYIVNSAYLTTGGTPGDVNEPQILKVLNVRIPSANRTLAEVTEGVITNADPDNSQESTPTCYAIVAQNAQDQTLRFWPVPTVDTTITVEGIATGVDLVADDDVPAIPEDFHDVVILGALASEYKHFDKLDRAQLQTKEFKDRLGELRLFIVKSRRLHKQGNLYTFPSSWWWPFGSPWYVAP